MENPDVQPTLVFTLLVLTTPITCCFVRPPPVSVPDGVQQQPPLLKVYLSLLVLLLITYNIPMVMPITVVFSGHLLVCP